MTSLAVSSGAEETTNGQREASELHDSSDFLQRVVEALPDPVFVKDREHRWIFVNEAFCDLLGQPKESLLGRTDLDGTSRAQALNFREKDERVLRGEDVIVDDELFAEESGRTRRFETRKSPFVTRDGREVLICVVRDVTENRRLEEALATREREYRTLVENSPDSIARYDLEGRVVFHNRAFFEETGDCLRETVGSRAGECGGFAGSDLYQKQLSQVLVTGADAQFELTWRDRSGRERCSHITLTPERDGLGTVRTILVVGRDISELHLARARVHKLAFFDGLTGLPNRALFHDRLKQALADGERCGGLGGVVSLDLDRFKIVNDTMGHPAGDELLRQVARRLASHNRDNGTIARVGGDEFAVLLTGLGTRDAFGPIAARLLMAFDHPFPLGTREVFVTASVGVAVFPKDSSDADELLAHADAAMYSAKQSGRGSVRFYTRELSTSVIERATLEEDLRVALARGEIVVHYQPKVDLADHSLVGAEALMRWRHLTRGWVPPDRFVPIAEDSGLIVQLGDFILRQSCLTAVAWNSDATKLRKVAVNLSARQFQSPGLVASVRQILEETGCRPQWLELEITESLLLRDSTQVLWTLEAFRALGFTIAIDDFGTGFSSLSYLTQFPIDTLKIDRSFVQKMNEPGKQIEVVKAIISMGVSLGLQIVAEGVEAQAQAERLRALGCHMAQGYFFGAPSAQCLLE